jgi:hypothetical protein
MDTEETTNLIHASLAYKYGFSLDLAVVKYEYSEERTLGGSRAKTEA